MTGDERNLLMLLARIVASGLRKPSPTDRELNEAIRRIEDAESRRRDRFIDKLMAAEMADQRCALCRPFIAYAPDSLQALTKGNRSP